MVLIIPYFLNDVLASKWQISFYCISFKRNTTCHQTHNYLAIRISHSARQVIQATIVQGQFRLGWISVIKSAFKLWSTYSTTHQSYHQPNSHKLHAFSDVSKRAYDTCLYLRTANNMENVSEHLIVPSRESFQSILCHCLEWSYMLLCYWQNQLNPLRKSLPLISTQYIIRQTDMEGDVSSTSNPAIWCHELHILNT